MTTSLHTHLQAAAMLVIDGLHAFDFSLADDRSLKVESMDGRELKRWTFSPEQIAAAVFDEAKGGWTLGDHELVCLSAFSANNDDDHTETEPQ